MAKNQYGYEENVWNNMSGTTRDNIIKSQGGTVIPLPPDPDAADRALAKQIANNGTMPSTQPLVELRGTAQQGGAMVGYDTTTKGVTVNNNPIDTTGLTNYGANAPAGYKPNTYYGTPDQVNKILSPYVYNNQNAEAEKQALAEYQQWASQPYVSPYASKIESVVNDILSRTFQYDPKNDAMFQKASKELTRNVMESMNARGILNSTVTENQVQQDVSDLLPQYEQIARTNFQNEGDALMKQVDMLTGLDATGYGRYQDQGKNLANALDVVMKMDESQYTKWKDAYTNRYNAQQDEIVKADAKVKADQQKIKDAWDRTSELGYVDNASSIVLGVNPGTLSKEAREAKIKREQDLEDQKTSLKNQKELAAYQNSLSKSLADYKNSTTADPSTLGNPEQVDAYYQLLNIYSGNGIQQLYANNAYGAYQNLITRRQQNVAVLGEKLYNKLLADVTGLMKNEKTYGDKGLTDQQQFSQQNTVYTKAMAMKKAIVKGGYNSSTGEIDPDTPQYSNDDIARTIANSGLEGDTLTNVYLQVFSEQELRDMGLWQD